MMARATSKEPHKGHSSDELAACASKSSLDRNHPSNEQPFPHFNWYLIMFL